MAQAAAEPGSGWQAHDGQPARARASSRTSPLLAASPALVCWGVEPRHIRDRTQIERIATAMAEGLHRKPGLARFMETVAEAARSAPQDLPRLFNSNMIWGGAGAVCDLMLVDPVEQRRLDQRLVELFDCFDPGEISNAWVRPTVARLRAELAEAGRYERKSAAEYRALAEQVRGLPISGSSPEALALMRAEVAEVAREYEALARTIEDSPGPK